jgi:hypothetical protein
MQVSALIDLIRCMGGTVNTIGNLQRNLVKQGLARQLLGILFMLTLCYIRFWILGEHRRVVFIEIK